MYNLFVYVFLKAVSEEKALSRDELDIKYPAKPVERGTIGRVIGLIANHYIVKLNREIRFHQYDVKLTSFNAPKDNEVKNKETFKEFFQQFKKSLGPAFDNGTIVYSFSQIMLSTEELPEDKLIQTINIEGRDHSLVIKKINEVSVGTEDCGEQDKIHRKSGSAAISIGEWMDGCDAVMEFCSALDGIGDGLDPGKEFFHEIRNFYRIRWNVI